MGRAIALTIFGAIGFAIGSLSFLAAPLLTTWLPTIVIDQGVAFAMISGAAGAAISTTVASVWAKRP
jgi:hypothetical protein